MPHLFARLHIANDPPAGQLGETASQVAARITFADCDGNVLIDRMIGGWSETPQRAETGRLGLSLTKAQLDLPANGVPHPVDIAMRAPGDPDCYAYNFENSNAPGLQLDKHRLVDDEFVVTVTVRGDNTEGVSETYVLRNERTFAFDARPEHSA